MWAMVAVGVATMACSSRHVPSGDRGAPEGGATESSGGSSGDGAAALGCHSEAGARLVCNRTRVDDVPWGSVVTLRQAIGQPPAPGGGTIVAGAYQLVSETLYGNVEPNTTAPRAGDRLRRILHVDCDVMNELYQLDPSYSVAAGNDCRRLVSREPGILAVSGRAGPGPDLRDEVSYTAHGSRLTLIFLNPYLDPSRSDLGILGSYTYVSEFALISGDAPEASVTSQDAGVSFPVPTGRDPRCPATAPVNGDPCSPDPAPLECEYDGDAFHRCTTFAACVMDESGVFHFSVDPPSACTPPNSPACPPSFDAARGLSPRLGADGGASNGRAPLDGIVCNYPEGVCGCESPPPATCSWSCNGGPSLVHGGTDSRCPLPRPLAGDPCTPGLECAYARGCGDSTSLGRSMICQAGYWADRGDTWFGCPEF